MNYFAYGSNMSLERIQKRCPSATVVAVAVLTAHSLRFHKPSSDGSAKADAFETGRDTDYVYGVIYNIQRKDVPMLDAAEGKGSHYARTHRKVTTASGLVVSVQVYIAMIVCTKDQRPYDWYLDYLVIGAKENKLPEAYTKALVDVVSKEEVVYVPTLPQSDILYSTDDEIPSEGSLFDHMQFEEETETYTDEPSYDYDYEERLDELAMYGLDEDDLL